MADNKQKATTAGGITGAASGALAGAGVGASISGPAAPIGGAIGALLGGVAGAVKGRYDAEQADAERNRIEKREDNARTRAVLDSLNAGLDPRIQDKGVEPASSASVAPPTLNPVETGITDSFNVGSTALLQSLEREQQLELSVFGEILKHYNTFQSDGYKAVNEINGQIDNLINDFKELSVQSDELTKQTDSDFQLHIEKVHQSLTQHQFTDSEVKLFRDILAGKKEKSKEQKTEFGANGDLVSAGAAVIDNVIESIQPSEDIVRDYNRDKKTGEWRQVGERRVNRDNGEGGPGTPKEKSSDRESRQKNKKKGLGLSGQYSDTESESGATEITHQGNDDDFQNRDETHEHRFTDEEINRLSAIFASHYLDRQIDTHKDLKQHYDKESRLKFAKQYVHLLSYRNETIQRAKTSPADYCAKYAPMVKQIFGDMKFSNRNNFYKR